jgi:DNA-binding MarR family transcriptional regulator
MLDTPHLAQFTALARFAKALRTIRAIEPGIPASQIATLLEVARQPGLTGSEYARRMGEPQPVTSRNLRNLGARARNGGPGLGLVRGTPSGDDAGSFPYSLTEKGEALILKIAHLIGVKA